MTTLRLRAKALRARRHPTKIAIGDFELHEHRIVLRKTGNSAAIDAALLREVAGWLTFTLVVRARGFFRRLVGGPGMAIRFAPDRPHARYMVRAAATWAGMSIASERARADAAFFFEDATRSAPMRLPNSSGLPTFNFGCTDIGKTRVARIFAEVFGYPLLIDPRSWSGIAVEKGEKNGAHDGRIVSCPRDPAPDHCYQRLIDTVNENGLVCDLRTHCIGGRPVLVWIKRRTAEGRFLPPNVSAQLSRPEDLFSSLEIEQISAFCGRMGADWCGLDILRDSDGRIYVVDVNKTDAGPVVALPFRQKLASIAIMAKAFEAMLEAHR